MKQLVFILSFLSLLTLSCNKEKWDKSGNTCTISKTGSFPSKADCERFYFGDSELSKSRRDLGFGQGTSSGSGGSGGSGGGGGVNSCCGGINCSNLNNCDNAWSGGAGAQEGYQCIQACANRCAGRNDEADVICNSMASWAPNARANCSACP